MNDNWMGKAVSIRCHNSLGVFQGTIKNANHNKITITRAFRNGIPLRKQNMEITISATDIEKLELLPTQNANNVLVNKSKVYNGSNNGLSVNPVENISLTHYNNTNNVNKSPINNHYDIKPSTSSNININKNINHQQNNNFQSFDNIDENNLNGNGNGMGKPSNINYNNNKTFGTPVDDPTMDEDFDFEKNLALFDKEAIWQEIDICKNKNKFKKQKKKQPKSYRHDENVLETKPMQTRQINVGNLKNNQEYVTDDGLVIPAIPLDVRECLQKLAELNGLIWLRQCDIFSRCTIEICMQLLGGARRLTQNNQHQWPIVCVVCDMPSNETISELGLSIARQLSTQGLKTIVYNSLANGVNDVKTNNRNNYELNLYNATGNKMTSNINKLPFCDLVVLTVKSPNLNSDLMKWINDNRSPVIAVDPPADGINNINIKCSIMPILPINNININSLGKLYLCNLGIPDSYFSDVGIDYKSPFGHKFVIPIHPD